MTTADRGRLERIARLLDELVACYAPSHAEGALLDLLVSRLRRAGFRPTVQAVEVAAGNLLLSLAGDDDGRLPQDVWLSHYDTVSQALGAVPRCRWRGDVAHGLGVVDTKGAIAALLDVIEMDTAAIRAAAPGLGIVLVCDEEDMQTGVRSLIAPGAGPFSAAGGERTAPSSALIFEPTGNQILGRFRAFAELELEVHDRQIHAACAAEVAGAAWMSVRLAGAFRDTLRARYGDAIVLNLRELTSGPSGFVTPAVASLSLDVHAEPTIDPREIESLFQATVAAARQANPDLGFAVPYAQTFRGQQAAPEHGPLAALAATFGTDGDCAHACDRDGCDGHDGSDGCDGDGDGSHRACGTFASHSDANVLAEAGCISTVFGPGDLHVAHGPDERISLVEIGVFAEVLHRAWPLYASVVGSRRPPPGEQ